MPLTLSELQMKELKNQLADERMRREKASAALIEALEAARARGIFDHLLLLGFLSFSVSGFPLTHQLCDDCLIFSLLFWHSFLSLCFVPIRA